MFSSLFLKGSLLSVVKEKTDAANKSISVGGQGKAIIGEETVLPPHQQLSDKEKSSLSDIVGQGSSDRATNDSSSKNTAGMN